MFVHIFGCCCSSLLFLCCFRRFSLSKSNELEPTQKTQHISCRNRKKKKKEMKWFEYVTHFIPFFCMLKVHKRSRAMYVKQNRTMGNTLIQLTYLLLCSTLFVPCLYPQTKKKTHIYIIYISMSTHSGCKKYCHFAHLICYVCYGLLLIMRLEGLEYLLFLGYEMAYMLRIYHCPLVNSALCKDFFFVHFVVVYIANKTTRTYFVI